MLYESYEKKILRFREIRDKILRYKALIITVMLAVLLLISAFLVTKGIMLRDMSMEKTEYVFGEAPEFEKASSLFSRKVVYEYRRAGSEEWHADVPSEVGTYEMRAVCNRSFSFESYGEIFTFTIDKRDITVSSSGESLTYGDAPSAYAELASGNYFESVEFTVEKQEGMTVCVTPVSGSVRIFSADGADVTEFYNINYESRELILNKRPIVIETASEQFVFDGTEHKAEEWSISKGGVAYGDRIVTGSNLFSVSAVDAGDFENSVLHSEFKVYNFENEDITELYDLTFRHGILSVAKRIITVKTPSKSKVYDGKPLFDKRFTLSGSVGDEDVIGSGYAEFTDAGKYVNSFKINNIILNGRDVTKNYAVVFDFGELEIKKRPFAYTTESKSFTYDAEEHFCGEIKPFGEYSLAEGHSAYPVKAPTVKDVEEGDVANLFEISILDGNSKNVNSNYEIIMPTGDGIGKISILPRNVVISTQGDTKIYDGTPLKFWLYGVTQGSMVEGHVIIPTEYSEITDVGSCDNRWSAWKVLDTEDNDVSKNYNISISLFGTLKVEKRPITVTTLSDSWVYDGSAHSAVGGFVSSSSVVNGHELAVTSGSSIIEPGSIENIGSVKIMQGDKDVSSNYEITVENGILTVTKRHLTVITSSLNVYYDGTPHGSDAYELSVSSDTLMEGHELVVRGEYPTLTNVGSIKNTISFEVYGDGEKLNKYYEIAYVYGDITVKPRRICITSASASKVYDGTELKLTEGFELLKDYGNGEEGYGLIEKDSLVLDFESAASIINAGSIENSISYKIMSSGIPVISNYDISEKWGNLSVTPRIIAYESVGGSWMYDGAEHKKPEAFSLWLCGGGEALLTGHYYGISSSSTVKNAFDGDVKNKLTLEIFDENGNDVTLNYQIDDDACRFGILSVTKRPVSIVTGSAEHIYDGEKLACFDYTYADGSLVLAGGDVLAPLTYAELLTAGQISNTWSDIAVTSADGNDVTDNYDITLDCSGTLTVKKRPIMLSTAWAYKVQDGTPLVNNRYSVVGNELAVGDKISLVITGTQVGIGKSENTIDKDKLVITNKLGENVTEQYEITYRLGMLEIGVSDYSLGTLEIVTGSASKNYDGTPLVSADISVSELPSGHYFIDKDGKLLPTLYPVSALTLPGKIENKCVDFNIIDTNGNLLTDLFDINYDLGELTVIEDRRKIIIRTGSDQKTYDRNPLTCEQYQIVSGSLLPGDVIIVSGRSQAIFGVTQNKLEFKVYRNGTDVTNQYMIEQEYGTLRVNPIMVQIAGYPGSKIYDGKSLYPLSNSSNNCYVVNPGVILDGDEFRTLRMKFSGSITDVGTVKAEPVNGTEEIELIKANGEDFDYYVYLYLGANLTVKSANIKVATPSRKISGSCEFTISSAEVSGELAAGHTVKISRVTYKITYDKEARIYDITATFGENVRNYKVSDSNQYLSVITVNPIVYDIYGNEATQNYRISTVPGKLTFAFP